jgi:hypothetical protein
MNNKSKLTDSIQKVTELIDLVKDNEYEFYLMKNLLTVKYELQRQMSNCLPALDGPTKSDYISHS